MQTVPTLQTGPVVQLPVKLVGELQASLRLVLHDLGRLERLLSHTIVQLLARFNSGNPARQAALPGMSAMDGARSPLRAAVVELQFQDPASQCIGRTPWTLQGCVFLLAAETMGQDDDQEPAPCAALAPDRPTRLIEVVQKVIR